MCRHQVSEKRLEAIDDAADREIARSLIKFSSELLRYDLELKNENSNLRGCPFAWDHKHESDENSIGETLMIGNLPREMPKRILLRFLYLINFECCIDYLYLPFEISTHTNIGAAFINFMCPACADAFKEQIAGLSQDDIYNVVENSSPGFSDRSKCANTMKELQLKARQMNGDSQPRLLTIQRSRIQGREENLKRSRAKHIQNPLYQPVLWVDGKRMDLGQVKARGRAKIKLSVAEIFDVKPNRGRLPPPGFRAPPGLPTPPGLLSPKTKQQWGKQGLAMEQWRCNGA